MTTALIHARIPPQGAVRRISLERLRASLLSLERTGNAWGGVGASREAGTPAGSPGTATSTNQSRSSSGRGTSRRSTRGLRRGAHRRGAHRRIGTRNVDIDPDDHPEQFDVATMRAKIRAHRVQRPCHPLLDVAPVQVMHEEQRRG